MDIFEFVRITTQKLKLFVLYWRRIVFAKNNFNVSFVNKLKANILGGFLADQWELYDLNLEKKKEYLSEFDWYRSRYINAPFDVMLNNKVMATEALKQYIRVPEIYVTKNRNDIFDFHGNKISTEETLELIKEKKNVFLKPYGKGKGVGVNHFEYRNNEFYCDNKKVEADELSNLFEKRNEWYLSETIKQHQYADILYDATVNTIRIITIRDPHTQKFKILFAVQRIGTSLTVPVDNASKGGLVCKIDLESGRLSEGRTLRSHNIYYTHPDSGVQFTDIIIPQWKEMKTEILSLAEKFPYLYFIAWDVVKMEDNTNCIVEANTSSGVNIIQLWGGQRNGELGEFYRFHNIIK